MKQPALNTSTAQWMRLDHPVEGRHRGRGRFNVHRSRRGRQSQPASPVYQYQPPAPGNGIGMACPVPGHPIIVFQRLQHSKAIIALPCIIAAKNAFKVHTSSVKTRLLIELSTESEQDRQRQILSLYRALIEWWWKLHSATAAGPPPEPLSSSSKSINQSRGFPLDFPYTQTVTANPRPLSCLWERPSRESDTASSFVDANKSNGAPTQREVMMMLQGKRTTTQTMITRKHMGPTWAPLTTSVKTGYHSTDCRGIKVDIVL
uniref:Uncharacterized protein n=1 Tax=Oryza meridionalis TaxID=40149 RepID=A0A0E0DHE8_9ORYZ